MNENIDLADEMEREMLESAIPQKSAEEVRKDAVAEKTIHFGHGVDLIPVIGPTGTRMKYKYYYAIPSDGNAQVNPELIKLYPMMDSGHMKGSYEITDAAVIHFDAYYTTQPSNVYPEAIDRTGTAVYKG